MTEIPFNLNNYVKVKLNESGFKHWEWHHHEIFRKMEEQIGPGSSKQFEDLRRPPSYFKDQQDKDGYVKFQTWDFMRIFGHTIDGSFHCNFSPNVIFLQP